MGEGLITATDVKHYFYCPRIIYFERVLHTPARMGAQQQKAKEEHEAEEKREKRRKRVEPFPPELEAEVERGSRVHLTSKSLNLTGQVDFLMKGKGEIVPIEYKRMTSDRGRPWPDHRYQLTAYALLIEEGYNATVKRALIRYSSPGGGEDELIQFEITPTMKMFLKITLKKIEKIISEETLPPINVAGRKCSGGCGYRWICIPT